MSLEPRWNTDAGAGRFPTTTWSEVIVAHDTGDEECEAAVGHLIEKYWKPVYFYLRRRGSNVEDAKDLAQGFFVYLFFERTENGDRRFKRYLHVGKSREDAHGFRKFIKHWLKRYFTDQIRHKKARKRGGHIVFHSIDDTELAREEGRFQLANFDTPEAAFDRVWLDVVIQNALRDMEKAMNATGKSAEFAIFRERLLSELSGDPIPNKELADKHGLAESTVSKYYTRGKSILQNFILDQIRGTSLTEEEALLEQRELLGAGALRAKA